MDLRVLRYFLAVAREESISGAAEYLHLSQPTLSRQLMDLEKELGKTLFIRGSRRITLTEQGTLLHKRASEILDLVEKTTGELTAADDVIAGDIYIGGGESNAVRLLASAAQQFRAANPQAMQIGWTQNVVILEADLSLQDKAWYIQAVKRYGWSKAELLRRIESAAHTEMTLDTPDEVCYTDSANTTSENKNHDEDTLCVFGKHLPQSNGRVCDEGSGKESRSVKTLPDRVSRNVCRRRTSLSTCQRETVRTWDQLQRKIFPSAGQGRLRPIRPADRHGQSQSCDDDPYVWQRSREQTPSAAGLYRSSQRYRGPVVHARL